jgi:endogenous inhibitor of DNA gyrase (YacG/DUF329 family)
MAKVETFRCDQCGKQKAEVNHWYVAVREASIRDSSWLKVMPWPDGHLANGARHLCGQSCVVAELNAWMNEARELKEQA